jgi:hypothetical protein
MLGQRITKPELLIDVSPPRDMVIRGLLCVQPDEWQYVTGCVNAKRALEFFGLTTETGIAELDPEADNESPIFHHWRVKARG